LRKLRKDGWHVVDRVDFEDRDVDHVVVGPSGVYAIDTKYTDSLCDLASKKNARQVRAWANKAYDAARPLRLLLVHQHRIRIEVTPMVVVWGTEVTGEPQMIDGVPVLKGRHWSNNSQLADYSWRMRIRRMLEKAMSLEEIAEPLNKKGVRTPHGSGKWSAATVRKA
jgi:Nuclease-related domain